MRLALQRRASCDCGAPRGARARAHIHELRGPGLTVPPRQIVKREKCAPVRPLVFGQYGEASPDVHATVARAAEVVAGREWARLGARSEAEARAFFAQSYRRRLGVSVVREFARHRLRRVQMVGVDRGHLRSPRPSALLPVARSSTMEFYAFQAFAPQGVGA